MVQKLDTYLTRFYYHRGERTKSRSFYICIHHQPIVYTVGITLFNIIRQIKYAPDKMLYGRQIDGQGSFLFTLKLDFCCKTDSNQRHQLNHGLLNLDNHTYNVILDSGLTAQNNNNCYSLKYYNLKKRTTTYTKTEDTILWTGYEPVYFNYWKLVT